jgi:DNA-binding beta-propeller fold protein YncE
MRTAPSQTLFDRIVAAAATVPQTRPPMSWPGRAGQRIRLQLPALASVAASAIALLLAFGILAPTRPTPGASPSPTPASTQAAAPTPETRLMGTSRGERLRLGGDTAPIDIIDAFGFIWSADKHAGAVSQIDPASLQEVARIPVGGWPAWFVVASNSLWVTDELASGIARIDQNPVASGVRVGDATICGAPALDGGDIWVSACDADKFLRIDPVANAVVQTIPAKGHRLILEAGGRLVTVGADGLAILDPASRSFSRVGAGVGAGGTLLGWDGTSVWVALNLAVERIDPANGQVIATFPYVGAQAIAFAGDHAWLTVDNRGVLKIDLASNEVVQTVPLLPSPQVPLETRGALWVTDYNNSDVWRIRP